MRDRIQDDLSRVAEIFSQVSADARHNLQGASESLGHRLNLVSREQFDTQKALVERLSQQLKQLEQRLEQLETKRTQD